MLSASEGLRPLTILYMYADVDMLKRSPCSLNFPNFCDNLKKKN